MNLQDLSKFRDTLTELKMILKDKFPDARVWVEEEADCIRLMIRIPKTP